MKKIFILVCGLVCFSGSVWAQMTDDITLEVFDAQSGEITSLTIDHSLHILEGNLPAEESNLRPACIVGTENWEQREPNKFPYSATVLLKLDHGRGICSGAMIGDYTVLTAAHCVLQNPDHNFGMLRNPRAIDAFAGGTSTEVHASGVNIFIPDEIRKVSWGKEFIKHDYAIIVLDKPLGKQTGYFGVEKSSVAVNDRIAALGFPGQRNHQRPWYSPGKVVRVEEGVFYHDADILPGNSGGPTLKRGDLRNIIGILSFEQPTKQINGSSKPADQALVSFVAAYRHAVPVPGASGIARIGKRKPGEIQPPNFLPPGILDKLKRKPENSTQLPPQILGEIRQRIRNHR